MKKIIAALATFGFCYSVYLGWFLSADPSRPILAIISEDAYRQVPDFAATAYLELTEYSLAGQLVEGSPAIPYLATAFDLEGYKNQEVLFLVQRFIEHGADIDAMSHGYTALNGAILANSPELVELLVALGADPSIAAQRQGMKYCNALASLEFALCIDGLGKQDLSRVIAVLRAET
ncbi:hypothetical protein [Biformimicrobium ophioploci]|uniref:Ankyrin repeat domain-containing protein n=1 Tax=Biformimicrobium ophioploci TaxID=3036711 RepID=A0ABQ6M368_9GAMM|nr:hypothetical protein [Microbulbifer sp. NKW57]GMG88757.1 hypothetical protein MNKW57_30780 [Microbulbifer sp. NKW57]